MGRGKRTVIPDRKEERSERPALTPEEGRKTGALTEVNVLQSPSLHLAMLANASPAGSQHTPSYASVVKETVDSLELEESPMSDNNAYVSMEDIEDEVEYWKPSLVCHILGGNPPLGIFQEFVRSHWNAPDIVRIALLVKGFYIVKFASLEMRNKAIEAGLPTFDRKPVIINSWTVDFDPNKVNDQVAPVWVRLPGLPIKYWGKKALSIITGTIGKPLRTDNATATKERLSYARALVEMNITKAFPTEVAFKNERRELVSYPVEFEWRPIRCSKCSMFGHLDDQCKREERMALHCEYCNLNGHVKEQCKRKGKQPRNEGTTENTEKNYEERRRELEALSLRNDYGAGKGSNQDSVDKGGGVGNIQNG